MLVPTHIHTTTHTYKSTENPTHRKLISTYLEYRNYKNSKMAKKQMVRLETQMSMALSQQAVMFEEKISNLTEQRLKGLIPQIEVFKKIKIRPEIKCDKALDIIKSIPEFDGKQGSYVTWRQAACEV